ncbi:hypothetical protein A9239_02530 [Methanosarcina sp. A14]|uniref:Uncharacterized protein n=1 Tax=Methanosarcina barkeri CM1 TaxID=796385 RepID=A0A0G3CF22_METBA|nr:hypothetical protein MCM1_3573 [Methanosarcina barkeri CM1]OEC91976.1 hypothetical protein A9239_02530 [Methanosarcina sp. A14]
MKRIQDSGQKRKLKIALYKFAVGLKTLTISIIGRGIFDLIQTEIIQNICRFLPLSPINYPNYRIECRFETICATETICTTIIKEHYQMISLNLYIIFFDSLPAMILNDVSNFSITAKALPMLIY